eukprot:g8409.t1
MFSRCLYLFANCAIGSFSLELKFVNPLPKIPKDEKFWNMKHIELWNTNDFKNKKFSKYFPPVPLNAKTWKLGLLNFKNSDLTNEIPQSWKRLTKMKHLSLHNCDLHGPEPMNIIKNMKKIEVLSLSYNDITLDNFDFIKDFPKLKYVSLANNTGVRGTLPKEVSVTCIFLHNTKVKIPQIPPTTLLKNKTLGMITLPVNENIRNWVKGSNNKCLKHMVKTDQKYIWAFVCWGASWKQCDKNDWMTNKWIGECNWQNDKRCYINMKYNMHDNGSPNQDIYFGGRGG